MASGAAAGNALRAPRMAVGQGRFARALGVVFAALVVAGPAAGYAQTDDEFPAELEPATTKPPPPPTEEPAPPPAETEAPPAEGAAGEGGIEAELMESVEQGEKLEEATQRKLTEKDLGDDLLEVFVLDRGFYLGSDLGVFFALGGTRGYSNVQPYLSVKLGVDIGSYFGLQLNLSTGYSSGNAVSREDRPPGDPNGSNNIDATRDFGLFNAGLEAVGAIRPTQRFAIEPRLGGGYTFIDPPLSQPGSANSNVAKFSGSAGHIVAGVDFKYLTLLTGFTAGLSLNFYGVIGEGAGYFIPCISVAASVRYTPVSFEDDEAPVASAPSTGSESDGGGSKEPEPGTSGAEG